MIAIMGTNREPGNGVDALPDETRRALLVAAASPSGSMKSICSALRPLGLG